MIRIRELLPAVILLSWMTIGQDLQAGGCDGCQATCGGRKVCRLVCEVKEVEVTCWACKCENFCVPGPSKVRCKHCEPACTEPGSHCPCQTSPKPKKFIWFSWCPGCAKVKTKKRLLKRTVIKEIPTYKWVVVNYCPSCCDGCGPVKLAPKDAYEGQEFPASQEELKQISLEFRDPHPESPVKFARE